MARTYIVARVWRDYPSDIELESLLSVGDRELALFLECQAAQWIREHTAKPTPGEVGQVPAIDWAQTVPEPDTAILNRVPPKVRERLGMAWLVHMVVTGRYPEMPMWALVHAAASPADAKAIVEAASIRMPNGPLVEVQIVEQSDAQTTAQWLGWERTLEDFERRHRNPFDDAEWKLWPSHPLKLFRDEVERVARVLELHRPVTAEQNSPPASRTEPHAQLTAIVATSVEAERDPNQLIQHARAWELVFEGTRVPLPNVFGMSMIKMLLQRPDEPISVEELLGEPPSSADGASDEPQFDSETYASVRDRLQELNGELDEATDDNDIPRREQLAADKHALINQLAAARSTGGRPRQMTGGSRSRARVKAASRLQEAIAKVAEAHPGCGRHLRESIVTPKGATPCYRPSRATRWFFGGEGKP